MNCQHARQQLHAYADGELDLFRRMEIEEHIAHCVECGVCEKNLRILKNAVTADALYHRAPTALRMRMQLTNLPNTVQRYQPWGRRSLIVASILLLVAISSTMGFLLSSASNNTDERLAESVVAGHVRSLQVDHAMDVASSDQHTVKPWFQGKLDFALQVLDLSQDGFVLAGGRLDYLVNRSVAALVYYRRLHAINVFMYPAANDEQRPVRRFTRQGFHIRHWQRDGMVQWAISDLNDQELDEFVHKFQEQSAPPSIEAAEKSSQ